MQIGIIGAGMAGLSCGKRLSSHGHRVRLFDKGRGAGGRMSTRRIETELGKAHCDHGAQYFTAHDAGFADQVTAWEAAGLVGRYEAAGDDAWVGTPGMNAPLKHLAASLDVRFGVRIDTIQHDHSWHLIGPDLADGGFDAVILATPAEQAALLLARAAPDMAAPARSTASEPCWAVLAAFAERLALPDVLRARGAIGWAARNPAKPARTGPESWVIHAVPDWSARHVEDDPEDVVRWLLAELVEQAGLQLPDPIAVHAHRWRYARSGALGRDCLWDGERRIGVCGDWLLGPRVENAWLSGTRLAIEIGAA